MRHTHSSLNATTTNEAAMLYAIFCYHNEALIGSWTQEEDDAVMATHAAASEKLARRGRLGPVARLMPIIIVVTLTPGRDPLIFDGPFAETKEQLLGFYIVDCPTLEDAIETARPFAQEGGMLEIRPVHFFQQATPDSVTKGSSSP
jgi:hypothetical protein